MSKLDLESISFMDPATQSCPYEAYKTLRSECPVYKMPEVGFYMITKYDDARMVMKDTVTFSNTYSHQQGYESEGVKRHHEIMNTEGFGKRPETLQRTDPPIHTKYRKLLNKAFGLSRVKEMNPYISGVVNDLIDGFIDNGECDFVSEYAVPIPCTIIADQLGVPREYLGKFKSWSDAMLIPASGMASVEEMENAARLEVESQHYFKGIFEEKRIKPTDDIISELVNADFNGERKLTEDELQDLINQLLTGGNETTTSSIAHGMWLLLRHPEQMKKVMENNDLISKFIEETIRYETPVQGLFRTATVDTEMRGVKIPKGSTLLVRYAALNRDEDIFEDPEIFNVERKDVGKHLAFGSGAHHCIGASLARAEMLAAFKHFFDRIDGIELAKDLPDIPHQPSIFLHQLKELHIKFRKR
jgi:cytochrome P450